MASRVPQIRLRLANGHPLRADGHYVLYWMTAFRRPHWNFALQRAVEHAQHLARPLIIFEPLRVRYRWTSARLHRFVIQGMRDNARALARRPVTYYPYVEPKPGAGTPLLARLAENACVVVTDDYPGFFLPTMVRTVAASLPARLELVDSNGIMPLRATERLFTVAHSYRRWMQKNVADHLDAFPQADPLARKKLPRLEQLPDAILRRWPAADLDDLLDADGIRRIPIDHSVPPVADCPGGMKSAQRRLRDFIDSKLQRYDEDRGFPDADGTSRLSPYLHFGHVSAHEIVDELFAAEGWSLAQLGEPNGKNEGFWNVSDAAEAFLDQLLTWREIGFNRCYLQPNHDHYETLPDWALKTLAKHADDERPDRYGLEEFEAAQTHDPLWNASQRQLATEGHIHNYLRMLWGKKILHWSRSPREALAIMIELNNKHGLDGRGPNAYSGIFWVLGRFDRPWGPERPIFGTVRYMTSDNTMRKIKPRKYLQRFGPPT